MIDNKRIPIAYIKKGGSLSNLFGKAYSTILSRLNNIQVAILEHNKRESALEKICALQAKKLEAYEEGYDFSIKESLIKDVIRKIDELNHTLDGTKDEELQYFIEDQVEDLNVILEENDIGNYRSEESQVFNPVISRILNVVTTDKKELDGLVVKSYNSAYFYKNRVIKKELVSVYKFASEEVINNEQE